MPTDRHRAQNWAALAIAALAALAIVGGLMLAGGPARGRMERHDDIRMGDLHRLSNHIACLSGDSGRMPADLTETAGCPGPVRREDPFTGEPYRVEAADNGRYRLCAGFELPPDRPPAGWWAEPGLRDGDCAVFVLPEPAPVGRDGAAAGAVPG